jgi:hypothetical protein
VLSVDADAGAAVMPSAATLAAAKALTIVDLTKAPLEAFPDLVEDVQAPVKAPFLSSESWCTWERPSLWITKVVGSQHFVRRY